MTCEDKFMAPSSPSALSNSNPAIPHEVCEDRLASGAQPSDVSRDRQCSCSYLMVEIMGCVQISSPVLR